MEIKRYRCRDLKLAMAAAHRDLGSDAVLMSYRKVRQKGILGIFRKRIIEVTFQYDSAKAQLSMKNGVQNENDESHKNSLEALLNGFITPKPLVLDKDSTQKIVLVLGASGSGKTMTIVKLATDFTIRQRKKVGIITTDTYRIGAWEQMRTCSDILGVPMEKVFYPDEIEKALAEMSDRELVFVDTASRHFGNEQYVKYLSELISAFKPEEFFVCIPATVSDLTLKETAKIYKFIDDYRLIITKLDETESRGELLNISWKMRKPIAYVTTGQAVPEDIEVMDIDKLVNEIMRSD